MVVREVSTESNAPEIASEQYYAAKRADLHLCGRFVAGVGAVGYPVCLSEKDCCDLSPVCTARR